MAPKTSSSFPFPSGSRVVRSDGKVGTVVRVIADSGRLGGLVEVRWDGQRLSRSAGFEAVNGLSALCVKGDAGCAVCA